MAGTKGDKRHANSTSYPNQKLNIISPKIIYRKFLEMLKKSIENDDILCFQDAYMSVGWRGSKVDYWIKKIPILESFKRDIQNVIVARINRKSLQGTFNSTASIWRMKMLGEYEVQKVEQTVNSNIDIVVDGEKFE